MWKLLSGLAALFCLISAVFAYLNYNNYRLESELAARAAQNKSTASEHKANAESVQAEKEVTLVGVENDRDTKLAQAAAKKAEAEEAEAATAEAETMLAERDAELKTMEAALDKVGDIKIVQQKLEELQTKLLEYDEQIASFKNVLAVSLQEERDSSNAIQSYRKLVSDQASGKMPAIRASVSGVIPEFGFVVINAGNSRGVVPQARFDVLRGGEKIGEVVVENVEPGRSVANIDESTLTAGVSIQAGDIVSTSGGSQS